MVVKIKTTGKRIGGGFSTVGFARIGEATSSLTGTTLEYTDNERRQLRSYVTDIRIRPAVESDAERFLCLWDALDTETQFMLFEPDERKATLESQKSRLANAENSSYVHILVLEDRASDCLAGFCAGRRNTNYRDKHTLEVVIGIRQSYTGKAWGSKLLTELEQWASGIGVRRLELCVMVTNLRGIALYQKCGFSIEGTKKDAVYLRTGFVDEYMMAKFM